jgi:L-serine deaminase
MLPFYQLDSWLPHQKLAINRATIIGGSTSQKTLPDNWAMRAVTSCHTAVNLQTYKSGATITTATAGAAIISGAVSTVM